MARYKYVAPVVAETAEDPAETTFGTYFRSFAGAILHHNPIAITFAPAQISYVGGTLV